MRAKHLGESEHEVGRRGARRQCPHSANPDHQRLGQEHRLAEHRRLCFDPSYSPTQDSEPVDHGRVRIGSNKRVGKRHGVPSGNHLPQMLQVHLVADAGAGRHDS